MKRSELKRHAPIRARAPMRKRSRPRKLSAAATSANGKDCTLQFPGCQNRRETVVLCHLRMFSGGGTGIKPDDCEAVYGCMHCHDILDSRTHLIPELSGAFNWEAIARAIVRTQRVMRAEGVLVFKGEAA